MPLIKLLNGPRYHTEKGKVLMVASRVIHHLVSRHLHPALPTRTIPPDIARTYSLASFKSLPKYHFPSEAILTILSKPINYKSPRLLIFPTPLCFLPTPFLSASHVSYNIYFCLLHHNVNSLMPRGMLSFAHC